ncbi:non-homologous end joining protein Ku [Streptomyces purpurogeneiscleroticus]|uniref:non-homologous end joining protein Ku n=1 Tax=Streptomyces purpurogeneiscleroticus TaxID=68259 RepID=UPI001CBC8828|nr:Ku protein [Streptomyces purpurogeneiscleroticus]MBZ4020061.1 Ku protein [Streptomyces purpurogeneiscleroticus]
MRSIWNGSISFGLVSIPVKMYSATDGAAAVSFVQIHEKDGGRIRYRKVCELDGEEVSQDEIGKGYQAASDMIVPLTDADLASLPLPTAKTLTILAFVDASDIDPLQMDKAYYLGANGPSAAKPYVLLRDALVHHQKVAIGKVALRNRETLAMLRVHDDAIVMHALLWPDQIRSPAGLAPKENVQIRENELTLAETLMDSLGELDQGELHDDYRDAVEELVSAKLEGGEPAVPSEGPRRGGKVIDLMAALEDSVRAARQERGGDEEEGAGASVTRLRGKAPAKTKGTAEKTEAAEKTGPAGKAGPAGKKTAAKKAAPAKKSAVKKNAAAEKGAAKKTATAKKTPAKKTASRRKAG